LDNGSTPEDIFGLKTLHSLEFEVIVIDHHNPVVLDGKKTAVDPYISLHLNPYIEGLDGKTCAGMLAYEIGRWVSEDYSNPSLPAVAGISDRSDIDETERYIEKSGRTRKDLEEIGIAMDFMAYQLKFDAGKGLFEELYEDADLAKAINEEVRKGIETQLESTLPYLRTNDISGITLSTIDLEKYTMRFKYPTAGKIVGMIHETVVSGKENMPFITIGYLMDMIIVRATKPVLPVSKMIERIRQDIPHAHIEGGGHECAGAMKFIPAHLSDILENIKKQIKELNYLENSPE
jgi:RecJ-like exonuclease